MKKRSAYLTALFLTFWLPSQALASVLAHCVTLDTTAPTSHVADSANAVEDCHGAKTVASNPADSSDRHAISTPDCQHCAGSCLKLQHMLFLDQGPQQHLSDLAGPAMRASDKLTGFSDFPIRPPKTILSV